MYKSNDGAGLWHFSISGIIKCKISGEGRGSSWGRCSETCPLWRVSWRGCILAWLYLDMVVSELRWVIWHGCLLEYLAIVEYIICVLAAGTPTTPLLPLISRGATKPIPSSTTLTSGVLLLLLLCVLLLFYLFLFYFHQPSLLTMIVICRVFMFANTSTFSLFSLSLFHFLTFIFPFFNHNFDNGNYLQGVFVCEHFHFFTFLFHF